MQRIFLSVLPALLVQLAAGAPPPSSAGVPPPSGAADLNQPWPYATLFNPNNAAGGWPPQQSGAAGGWQPSWQVPPFFAPPFWPSSPYAPLSPAQQQLQQRPPVVLDQPPAVSQQPAVIPDQKNAVPATGDTVTPEKYSSTKKSSQSFDPFMGLLDSVFGSAESSKQNEKSPASDQLAIDTPSATTVVKELAQHGVTLLRNPTPEELAPLAISSIIVHRPIVNGKPVPLVIVSSDD